MVRYRTKPSQNQKLEQKIVTAAEPIFLVQIMRDLSNLKDQIKKEWI